MPIVSNVRVCFLSKYFLFYSERKNWLTKTLILQKRGMFWPPLLQVVDKQYGLNTPKWTAGVRCIRNTSSLSQKVFFCERPELFRMGTDGVPKVPITNPTAKTKGGSENNKSHLFKTTLSVKPRSANHAINTNHELYLTNSG